MPRSRSSACPAPTRDRPWPRSPERCRGRGSRGMCGSAPRTASTNSMTASRCGFRRRTASPARMSPNCICMAAVPFWRRSWRGRRGERLRDGIAVAILGPPNAGKSSILNQLARREAAITSPIAGTTRDVIEVAIDLAGYPIVLADTAGLRDSADVIEQEGLRRALKRAEEAELRLFVFDATRPKDAEGAAAWPSADTLLR